MGSVLVAGDCTDREEVDCTVLSPKFKVGNCSAAMTELRSPLNRAALTVFRAEECVGAAWTSLLLLAVAIKSSISRENLEYFSMKASLTELKAVASFFLPFCVELIAVVVEWLL